MKITSKLLLFSFLFLLLSCSSHKEIAKIPPNKKEDFTIAFGSCNKQYVENILWKEIKKNNPNLWIWGGDNIYADTDDMAKLKADYEVLGNQTAYLNLVKDIPVLATWDDHDYGFNDSGKEFHKKDEAQKAFLDFFEVDENSERRKQPGVYNAEVFKTAEGSVKVIVLDTRYFRDKLTKSTGKNNRFTPNINNEGSILGDVQWKWFTEQLNNSNADFNIIVSSIQVLSAEHGFETWGNFPHEVEKLKNTIVQSNAKGVLLLSGDRHISEFSKTEVDKLSFPLIDFTSSGLTHSYNGFTSEPNKHRILNVVSEISFGLLNFDFKKRQITMQMRGRNNKLLQEIVQVYR